MAHIRTEPQAVVLNKLEEMWIEYQKGLMELTGLTSMAGSQCKLQASGASGEGLRTSCPVREASHFK